MSDLISRQAAIREYQEVCKGMKCGECPLLITVNTEKGSHLITDCKLEAFLHDLPSAQPEPHWIPCSERLPEERGFYLTTTKDKAVYCDYWNEDNFDRTEMVIAWMPLPEPYRGEI